MPKTLVGPTKSPVQLIPGFSFRAKKRLGFDTYHSSSTWAEFKNVWRCTYTLRICLLGVDKAKLFCCLCVYVSLGIVFRFYYYRFVYIAPQFHMCYTLLSSDPP